MGMLSRMSTIVKSKMNRILDNAEDPRETLDYSYEKQLEMLRNVKRGVVEMVAAKRQIQQQADKVRENVTRLERQAEQAVDADREDLALMALERKNTSLLELQGLEEQIAGMELEQEKVTQAEQRLSAKVAAFRNKKEVIKAQYTAEQAQVRIASALSGISEEMGDVGLAVERAEAKTSSMKARASAIDELAEAGVLEDFTGESKDDITRELEKMSVSQSASDELAALKGTAQRARTRTGEPAMIVRISSEGQYNLPGSFIDQLNEIDNELVEAVEAEDQAAFEVLLKRMLDLVREHGSPLPVDELVESDLILPEPDLTLREAEELFVGEGLLPG